jgi:hypothetical protein
MIRIMRALLLLGAAILAAIGCSSSVPDYPMATPCLMEDGGCPPPTITDPDGGAMTTTTSGTTTSSGTGGAGHT